MKRIKHILAVITAVLLVLAMALPAMAADPTGTLKITSARKGETYALYRILDVTHEDGTDNYAYTLNEKYKAYFTGKISDGKLGSITIADPANPTSQEIYNYIATDFADDKARDFAADLGKWIVDKNIAADKSELVGAATDDPETSEVQAVEISGLEYGYYLLRPTKAYEASGKGLVTFSLDTVTKEKTIQSKTEYPVPEKTVEDDSKKTDTAKIGDELDFYITSRIPDTTEYAENKFVFTFNDTMDYLTFEDGTAKIIVKHSSGNVDITNKADIDWNNGTKKLTVSIGEAIRALVAEGKTKDPQINYIESVVELSYKATVDSNAPTTHHADNTVSIRYSRDPSDTQDSKEDKTRTFLVDLELQKVTSDGTELAGSKWKLEYFDESVAPDGAWVDITAKYDEAAKLTAGTEKTFSINGLKLGKYRLEETEPPTGYTKLPKSFVFDIEGTIPTDPAKTSIENLKTTLHDTVGGMVKPNGVDQAKSKITIQVTNTSHGILPATGGAGLYVVAVVALLALLGFGGTAFLKRKLNSED